VYLSHLIMGIDIYILSTSSIRCLHLRQRYALKCLLKEHKVKKVRGLGTERIDYFYQIMNMNSDRNRRR
ncbi:MAG: hypothetical protein WCF03_20855, partial [Nitrososphaeraceae archaeon]